MARASTLTAGGASGGAGRQMSSRNGNGNGALGSTSIATWVAVALSLGSAFWTVANPRDDIKSIRQDYDNRLIDMKRDYDYRIAELTKVVSTTYVTIAEFKEYAIRKDKDTDRVELAQNHFSAELVPRSEHMQHWSEQTDRSNALKDSIAEIRHDFTGSWNIGKQLDTMQKQIDTLMQRFADQNSVQRSTVTVNPVSPATMPPGHGGP